MISLKDFLARAEPSMTGCYLWQGAREVNGYGTCGYFKAHRLAWILQKGDIPEGLMVLHKCDVRECVNIDHLFLGTHLDNQYDKIAKDRHAKLKGIANGNSFLSDADVLEMRKRYFEGESAKSIAIRFKYSPANIHRVLKGRNWKHLPMPNELTTK